MLISICPIGFKVSRNVAPIQASFFSLLPGTCARNYVSWILCHSRRRKDLLGEPGSFFIMRRRRTFFVKEDRGKEENSKPSQEKSRAWRQWTFFLQIQIQGLNSHFFARRVSFFFEECLAFYSLFFRQFLKFLKLKVRQYEWLLNDWTKYHLKVQTNHSYPSRQFLSISSCKPTRILFVITYTVSITEEEEDNSFSE